MKNKMLFMIAIVSSLFFINNVSAQTYNLIFDYNNSNLDLLKENLSIVDEIRKLSDEYNTNNYTYYVSYHKTGGSYFLSVGVGTYSCSSAYYSISYSTSYKSLYNGVFSYLNGDNNLCDDFEQIGTKILSDYVTLNLSNLSDETKQTFLNNVKEFFINGTNKSGFMEEQTYQSKPNLDVFLNNNFSVPVYSNVDLKFVKAYNDAYSYDKSIQVDDNVYNYNEIIPTYYDYFGLDTPKTPIATFNSTNFGILTVGETKKNYVTDVKIDIEYSDFDTDKYSYYYSIIDNIDDDKIFKEIYSTKNKIFSFHVKKNCYIIQKIVDKSTNEIVHTSSYDVTGIGFPIPNAKFNHLEDVHYDNDTSKPILYKLYELHFDFFNTDLYEYAYRDNYINSTITVKENNTKIYIWDNYSVPVTVYDKKTGDIVAEYNFSVNGITGSSTPIAFYEVVDVPRSCKDDVIVPVKEIYISFSFVYTEEFSYQYTIIKDPTDEITNWVDESSLRYNNDFYFKLEENSYIITRIINKSTNEIVYTSTYDITGIEEYDTIKCDFANGYGELFDEVSDITSDTFFANILAITYNSCPTQLRLIIRISLILLFLVILFKVLGW